MGAFAVAVAISLLVSLMIDSTPDVKSKPERPKEADGEKADHLPLALLVGLHCLIFIVIFLCLSRYISAYAVLNGMSKDESVVLMSAFYSTFTISRFVSIFLASKFQPQSILIAVDSVFSLSVVVFFYYGSLSHRNLSVTILLLGATSGPIYAAGTAYLVSRLTQLNHAQTSIIKFMSNCGGLVPPLAIGPLIESAPEVFPEVIFLSTVLLLIVASSVVQMKNCSTALDETNSHEKPIERLSLLSKVM